LPTRGGGGFIRRIGFGGSGGASRPVVVSTSRIQLQTEPLCASTPEERARNVGEAVKFENKYLMGFHARQFCSSNGGQGLEYETTFADGAGRGVYRWTGQCDWYRDAVYMTEVQAPQCR
jgi:hypothetical protein